jgi:F-type H+-transporting ATPase subunit alpha
MSFEKQVAIIYAATNGYLDEIDVDELKRFEKEFLEYAEVKSPKLLPGIAEKLQIDDEIEKELKSAIESFVKGFKQEAN